MAHPARSIHTNNDLLLWALVLSLGLHSAALGLLPGFTFSHVVKTTEPLTVELQQLPPPPVAEPEKPKPPEPPKPQPKPKLEKIPPKIVPQPVTPPPVPVVIPQHTEVPPPAAAVVPPKAAPSPPPVVAVEQKPVEPPPVFTAPVATPNPPPQVPDEDTLGEVRAAYGRLLNSEFSKHTKYPAVAAMKGWEGKVRIKLQIDKDGNVLGTPEVTEGSGYKMLDDDAVKTILKCSPLPLPPAALFAKPVFINTIIDYHKQR
ncbi:MAG TPA: energy transducer TonB [Methylophilaceae bacterium]